MMASRGGRLRISMADVLPRSFGKYLLERRLGVGGMAETFVARREGAGGIEQHVCLKRVLPAFNGDKSFRDQFQREARLAARLRHSNIVGTIDYGSVDEVQYMALELVDGFDGQIQQFAVLRVRRFRFVGFVL